jgi:hypothetical protein
MEYTDLIRECNPCNLWLINIQQTRRQDSSTANALRVPQTR